MAGPDWAARFNPSAASATPAEEEEEARRPRGPRRLSASLFGIVVALILAALVVRISGANLLFNANPKLGASLMPSDPRAVLAKGMEDLQVTGGTSEQTRKAIHEAFAKVPLEEEPLLIEAVAATARGDTARADQLIAVAHRRNPRSRYALLLVLQNALKENRADDAASAMAVLSRLLPQAGNLLVSELARMASDPRTQPSIRRVIEADPQMRNDLLEELAKQGAEPDVLFGFAGPIVPPAPRVPAPRWQKLMLDGLVARGRIDAALQAWTRLTGAGANDRIGGVYDPDFTGRPGGAPFNWATQSSNEGYAELVHGGPGLQAEYYAREPVTLASQLIVLSPGRYQFGVQAEGAADGKDGRLIWTISCQAGGKLLAEVPVADVDFTPRPISGAFTVPADCASQALKLVGKPAEFPKDQQVKFTHLRIAKAGQ